MKYSLLLFCFILLFSCKKSKTDIQEKQVEPYYSKTKEFSKNDTVKDIGDSLHKKSNSSDEYSAKKRFKYRNINDSINSTYFLKKFTNKEIHKLYGTWTITSIAEAGGTMQTEKTIQEQIGKKLIITNETFKFNFLNDNIKINTPKYEIIKLGENDNLKGTSFSCGYKTYRNYVFMLKCSESYYFELIDSNEMSYYYDGRIYFLTRK